MIVEAQMHNANQEEKIESKNKTRKSISEEL